MKKGAGLKVCFERKLKKRNRKNVVLGIFC